MSHSSKILVCIVVALFLLACSVFTQPVQNSDDLAKTAQAIGSAIPAETLAAFGTNMPDWNSVFNPQGAPVQEWKGIPVMPQATEGQEFTDRNAYSFTANVAIADVQEFYSQKLPALGWSQPYDIPNEDDTGLMLFQKGDSLLSISITSLDGFCVVILTQG